MGIGIGATTRAQLLGMAGQLEPAIEQARTGTEAFARAPHVAQHSCRYLWGLLEGGDSGRERCKAAVATLGEQGWREPERALRLLITPELLAGGR